MHIWLVVSYFFTPKIGEDSHVDEHILSNGLVQSPTRQLPKRWFWFGKVFFYKNDDLCYLRDVRMLGLQAFLANMFYLAFWLGKNAYFRP